MPKALTSAVQDQGVRLQTGPVTQSNGEISFLQTVEHEYGIAGGRGPGRQWCTINIGTVYLK